MYQPSVTLFIKSISITKRSSDLSWTKHINQIVQKVNFIIKNLISLIPFLNENLRLRLFITNIIPIMLYASEVWGILLQGFFNRDKHPYFAC